MNVFLFPLTIPSVTPLFPNDAHAPWVYCVRETTQGDLSTISFPGQKIFQPRGEFTIGGSSRSVTGQWETYRKRWSPSHYSVPSVTASVSVGAGPPVSVGAGPPGSVRAEPPVSEGAGLDAALSLEGWTKHRSYFYLLFSTKALCPYSTMSCSFLLLLNFC